jgi:hypothetical protein
MGACEHPKYSPYALLITTEAPKVPLALTQSRSEAVTPAAVALPVAAGLRAIIMIMGPQGLISGRKFKCVLLALKRFFRLAAALLVLRRRLRPSHKPDLT